MTQFRSLQLPVAVALLVPLLAGCSSARLFTWPWQKEKIVTADAKNPVHRIVCMWEPSEGRSPDGMPARGFAGQILFFTRTSSTPVRVEGDVKIYVFDDQGPNGNPTLPISEFDFVRTPDGDAWNRHLTITTLGPSYNVFVPYMRRARHQARCAVQLRLVSEGEPPIFSDVATIVLPGPVDETGLPAGPAGQPVTVPAPTRTVSHFVDGPLGRQPVDASAQAAGWETAARPGTPPIGAVVKTQRGLSVTAPRQQQVAGTSQWASGAGHPASTSHTRGTPIDADRLSRIEQMLEQLAARQQRIAGATPAAADAISPHGVVAAGNWQSDAHPVEVRGPEADPPAAVPDGFELVPVPSEVAFAAEVASKDARPWNDAQGVAPAQSHAVAPLGYESGGIHARGPAEARRQLKPRPSWFDQTSRPETPFPQSRHPLQSSSAAAWDGFR